MLCRCYDYKLIYEMNLFLSIRKFLCLVWIIGVENYLISKVKNSTILNYIINVWLCLLNAYQINYVELILSNKKMELKSYIKKQWFFLGTIHLRRQHVLGGQGCPHVPMVKMSQYIRIKNPLHIAIWKRLHVLQNETC